MNGFAIVNVSRFNPECDKELKFHRFEVPYDAQKTVLDSLEYIYENLDSSLAFRSACRSGCCGICALKVNGKSCLPCATYMAKKMKIEPLSGFKIIRDLVVDLER